LGAGDNLPFELGQNRPTIGTREAESIAQVATGQIVQFINLVQFLAEHLLKLQPLVELVGLFIWRLKLVVNVDLTRIVFITHATQSTATATQAFQVVTPDFVLQQLKQCAFMAGKKDIQVFAFGLSGEIKGNDFLFNILWVLSEFERPFFRQRSEVFDIHNRPPLLIDEAITKQAMFASYLP
jgi:hypothetical protein